MARTAKEKTKVQIAADKARKDYSAAKEKATSPGAKEADKKAMEHAKTVMNEAIAKENRERFETVGAGRVEKAIKTLDSVATLANPKSYKFDADDVSALTLALDKALETVKSRFANALSGKTETKTESGFSFTAKV